MQRKASRITASDRKRSGAFLLTSETVVIGQGRLFPVEPINNSYWHTNVLALETHRS
jgi:hypothetical protein